MTASNIIQVSEPVADALARGRPVVALETAVITHGLPREPPDSLPELNELDAGFAWAIDKPLNLQCARMLSHVVRAGGATPAMIGVIDGRLRIGLDHDDLNQLATVENADKASSATLAATIARGGTAGLTVSATLIGCTLARPAPIRVFATGGIGGVHRGWAERPDISADLLQLARSQVCVVCSGGKSILDLAVTMETMETLGITVAGYQTSTLPGFFLATTGIHLSTRLDSPEEAAALCKMRWDHLQQPGGVLVAQPAPIRFALDAPALNQATLLAEEEAERASIAGAARTPFLLSRLAALTHGRTLQANLALLAANASLAARVANALVDNRGNAAGRILNV